eukprot:NODE_12632_length_1213_cov_2.604052.p1 GENE.NODE_12632_length_1213_cov_2.604052~~NODE_12632_length_1213_cov_2.604052.p1  ORF type:complete len:369 (-),score=57.29 NODE_12632_length_1213_cov_2.604052:105-1061(-)
MTTAGFWRRSARDRGGRCGARIEQSSCNKGPCGAGAAAAATQDCQLYGWTPWSRCSKACGGGHSFRERPMKGPSTKCTVAYGRDRWNSKTCNTQACPGTFYCTAKMDIVMILDHSGSIGPKGWEQMKIGAKRVVKSFDMRQTKIAAMHFAGPTTFEAYKRCLAGAGSVTECKMIDLSDGFSSDANGLASAISRVSFTNESSGTTALSLALSTACAKFSSGRPGVDRAIIVFTDDRPTSLASSSTAVKRLHAKGVHIVWVVAGLPSLDWYRSMSPRPEWRNGYDEAFRDTVIKLSSFAGYASGSTASKVVTRACSKSFR